MMFPQHSRACRLVSLFVIRIPIASKAPSTRLWPCLHSGETSKIVSLANPIGFLPHRPEQFLFHRQIDWHAYLTSGFRIHLAISYVWSEWRDNASDKLPSWPALQKRLMSVLGEHASPDIKAVTGKATRCCLDCMCIYQESREDKSYWIPRMDEIYYEARCTWVGSESCAGTQEAHALSFVWTAEAKGHRTNDSA
jgi:hypothetical protein